MLACPTCSKRLYRTATPHGGVYACRACGGRAISVGVLRKKAKPDFFRRLRNSSTRPGGEGGRPCPLCLRPMPPVDFGEGDRQVELDACHSCQIIWFDPGEQLLATSASPQRYPEPPQPPPRQPGRQRRAEPAGPGDDRAGFALGGPDHAWQLLPAILGLPIEYGPNRLRDHPLVTWGLAAVMCVLFVSLFAAGQSTFDQVIYKWGLIPDRWARRSGLTVMTSFFLHAGWWHLIGNTYFLLIFGDNVEDHLGRLGYVLLLVGAHVGGMWLHAAITSNSGVPCIGASAGISGVIAYYAIVFPRAKIGVFLWVLTLFRILRMPALVALLLYAGLQVVGMYLARGDGGGGTAYLAHIGGLLVGAGVGAVALIRRDTGKI